MQRFDVVAARALTCVLVISGLIGFFPWPARAAEDLGVFERILEASGSFDATTAAFESALAQSTLTLQGKFDLVLKEPVQRGRVYLLTSQRYEAASAGEPANTASAQVLRVGIYEYGDGRRTQIDMTNPVAHAMVFYAGTSHYDALLAAARSAADEIRAVVAGVPGKQVGVQLEPRRSEASLNRFNGDGPARMMTKWRNWQESQRTLFSDKPENFPAAIARVEQALHASRDRGIGDSSGWRLVAEIPVGPAAVYFGISNDYTESTCVRINSNFRSDGKSKDAPFPGVDHGPALPLEILVFNDGTMVKAVQYGEMWRMQLYFWDSGYLAFAQNSGVPGTLFDSIEAMFSAPDDRTSGTSQKPTY